jgi:hypothetical protein
MAMVFLAVKLVYGIGNWGLGIITVRGKSPSNILLLILNGYAALL